jgi:hypothetical protein
MTLLLFGGPSPRWITGLAFGAASSGFTSVAVFCDLSRLGVHVDQHLIRGLPLAAVTAHCVTIIKGVLEKLIPNQSVLALPARTAPRKKHVTGDNSGVDGDKPVFEDSSFLVREKTRASLVQSAGFTPVPYGLEK